MAQYLKLSTLLGGIEATINNEFGGGIYWIQAEVTDVKKQPGKRWCFLKFIEKDGSNIIAEIKGVFWSNTYGQVESFERETKQEFVSGLEIKCGVRVRFHKRFGIDLEVMEIDVAYAIGKLEQERKQILERLVKENPGITMMQEGVYQTPNKATGLPMVIKNIALITAPNSDGLRDFTKVVENNKYGYAFRVVPFLTQIQGDLAAGYIMNQLDLAEQSGIVFDVVVIVRGGGSDTDFKAFNHYELARRVAFYKIPVITGIGHDRNTSIVDLMVRQMKTPTEVGMMILDHNLDFEQEIEGLKERMMQAVDNRLKKLALDLYHYRQRIENLSPTNLMKRGFAIVTSGDKIITHALALQPGGDIQINFSDAAVNSKITTIKAHETEYDF